MWNLMLAEELMREHHAQRERDVAYARLLQEAARARRPRRAAPASGLHQAAAASVALAGGWLVRTGNWLQSMVLVPVSPGPCR